jgi:hypothetical protein
MPATTASSMTLLTEHPEPRRSAIDAARAILNAYDRGVLPISAQYLADTLRMLLANVETQQLSPQ